MAKNKVLLIDADVISHFIATGRIDTLTAILAPHAVYVVDNVYKEATWHPTDSQRKAKVDAWMTRCKVFAHRLSLYERPCQEGILPPEERKPAFGRRRKGLHVDGSFRA